MKINGIALDQLLLNMTLGQFKSIPDETGIDYTFSQEFQEQIHHTVKKSKSRLWRFWKNPVKRVILIAVLAAVLGASVLWAFPGVRHALIDFYKSDEPAVHIPQVVETYYIPTYEPEGFTLTYRARYYYNVVYLWQKDSHGMIEYRQELITSNSSSHPTNTETDNRVAKILNGFTIFILFPEDGHPFTAQWTDGRYNYSISIPSSVSDPYAIFEALVNSLVAVGGCAEDNANVATDTIQIEEPTNYHTSMYSITAQNGKYILTPTVPLPKEDHGEVNYSKVALYPTFTSIQEMRHGILNGPISQYELSCLVLPSQNTDHSIEICDPHHLYEFTAPEEFHLMRISWSGKSYGCSLYGSNVHGGIDCYDQEDYDKSFHQNYQDFLTNPLVTITGQNATSDRFATVYYGDTGVAKLKYICYELSTGDKTMYIQEEYLLESKNTPESVSSDVPSSIQFWGKQNGGYFQGTFFDFTERPSIQWLSQFGIVPYETSVSS